MAANNILHFAFERQNLIQECGNKNRVGQTRINAQGDDKVHASAGARLGTEKLHRVM